MIYKFLTIQLFDFKQIKSIRGVLENHNDKINLIYSYEQILWQGPMFINIFKNEICNKNLLFVVNCKDNVNLVLKFLRLGLKHIIFFSEDKIINFKIKCLSEKYQSQIYYLNKFKKIYNLYDDSEIKSFLKYYYKN